MHPNVIIMIWFRLCPASRTSTNDACGTSNAPLVEYVLWWSMYTGGVCTRVVCALYWCSVCTGVVCGVCTGVVCTLVECVHWCSVYTGGVCIHWWSVYTGVVCTLVECVHWWSVYTGGVCTLV